MLKNKINFRLLNILILLLVLYIGASTIEIWGGVVATILGLILPFVVAFSIAYALSPITNYLEEKGVRKQLSVAIVTMSVLSLIVVIISITLPLIYDQLIVFSGVVAEVIQDFSGRFDINLGELGDSFSSGLNDFILSMGQIVSTGTIDFLGKSVGYVTQGIIVLILSVYFLYDMEKYRNFVSIFSKKTSYRSFRYIKQLDKELTNYIKGLFINTIIQFIEYTLLFFIIGHPNWLLLGILASVTTVIPYFGGLFTNLIAIITASVVSTPLFIATIIICAIFPQLDGYVISPKVYGKTNNINPILAIVAVSIGGTLAGFIGIIVSLPIVIVLSHTFKFFKEDIKDGMLKVKKSI